jgi:sensor c-di-GMP phosphodiesterase-like protein
MLAAITGGVLCGVFAGYFVAREITLRVTELRLDQYASQLMADGEASSAELRTALAAVDIPQHGFCSEADISYLRALLFESEYLKDAGRMRENGTVECSAAMGRLP